MASTKTMVETNCPDSLSKKHLEQFGEIGYVAFESVLTTDEVSELRLALNLKLLVRLCPAGRQR